MLMCVRAWVFAIYGEIVVGRSIPNAMLGLQSVVLCAVAVNCLPE